MSVSGVKINRLYKTPGCALACSEFQKTRLSRARRPAHRHPVLARRRRVMKRARELAHYVCSRASRARARVDAVRDSNTAASSATTSTSSLERVRVLIACGALDSRELSDAIAVELRVARRGE